MFREKLRLGYLMDIEYIGNLGVARCTFLDPKTNEPFYWYDQSGHKSYLLTDASEKDIKKIFGKRKNYLGCEEVEKYNAITDSMVKLRKVTTTDPLAIGGDSTRGGNYRTRLQELGFNVWEAWIRYVDTYRYDMNLEMGMPYYVTRRKIIPVHDQYTNMRMIETVSELGRHGIDTNKYLEHWIRLFETPLPPLKFMVVDIEVLPETARRMPNANMAIQPIIAVSIVTSDGRKEVWVLIRDGVQMGKGEVDGKLRFFKTEHQLVTELLQVISEYPFVVSFNGDIFDMLYIYNRSKRIGVDQNYNTIRILRRMARLTSGIHLDLYPFFKNPSIQNYAFSGKYKDFSLDSISKGLLGRGKIEYDGDIGGLSYIDLARYCMNDGILTYDLMTFGGNIVSNLIMVLSRMANTSPYIITRYRIGEWLKSSFFFLLRKYNMLIPNKEELRSKGEIQTAAKIKGKGYQGAIVRDPTPGVFFWVVVMDFASLYPSETKDKNIGFATINCFHEECKSNQVPDTTHHVCTINRAIEADVVGGLRDIRVFIYKPFAKMSEYYDCLQQAIKVFINASYGVFANEMFGLFCPPVAESIVSYSRLDMTAGMNKAEELGIQLLGGDTDSVFLFEPSVEQTTELQDWARRELKLDFGIDKVYRYAIFSDRKKNYLGVFENGTVDVKGLTGKKSNIPPLIKKTFFDVMDVLGEVMNPDDYEGARGVIEDKVIELQKIINNRGWEDINDMMFTIRLSKNLDQYETNPQHVKAANMLVDEGYQVRGGDNVRFVKTTTEEGVAPLELADPDDIDVEKYLEQTRSVFEQITDPMGIDINLDRTADGKLVREISLVSFMRPASERKI